MKQCAETMNCFKRRYSTWKPCVEGKMDDFVLFGKLVVLLLGVDTRTFHEY